MKKKHILSIKQLYYTYRFVFLPETIGSISYINKNIKTLKKNVVAGFNLTCLGDNKAYSYISSRYGNTLADKVVKYNLSNIDKKYIQYSYLERGSDERQYCSPGVDLPLCTIMRSKFDTFKEYHTSLDNLQFIKPKNLMDSLILLKKIVETLEINFTYKANILCEPQLSKYGLYPSISTKLEGMAMPSILNFFSYCDGKNDLIEISKITSINIFMLDKLAKKLLQYKIIRKIKK